MVDDNLVEYKIEYKKILKWSIVILLIAVLIFGIWLRTLNINHLKDATTGESMPLALDPFYFLRISQTLLEQGSLPAVDTMRYPSLEVGFSNEVMPRIVVYIYKFVNVFSNNISLEYINIISPVIFFALGLIAFFFLVFLLTKSKPIAIISSIFLTIIPTYLYRTIAGFSDHESIGMLGFFLAILAFGFALNHLKKKPDSFDLSKIKNNILIKGILLGLLVGFFSTFSIAAWGGGARFVFMIIPLSFALFWLIKFQPLINKDKINSFSLKYLLSFLVFYASWFFSSLLFSLIYGYNLSSTFAKYFLSSSNIITNVVLLFLIIDYLLVYFIFKNKIKDERVIHFRPIFSGIVSFVLGSIGLTFIGKNIFSMISDMASSLLHPFGTGRIGLTVAENKQPYLLDWIGQTGEIFFWMFVIGMVFVGFELSKKLMRKKYKFSFMFAWVAMISGIMFTRISSSSLFNGENFISGTLYFLGLILFFVIGLWIYFNERIKIRPELIVLGAWLFSMIMSGRGAIRLFFAITPFVCFMASFACVKMFEYAKKSKDDLKKMIYWIIFALMVLGFLISAYNFYGPVKAQAEQAGPSAHLQWQNSMEWVRDNTPDDAIFVHWWDYGYWVQSLGKRATVTDGGHANGFWDHLIGRYILTTPKPETALSFMKAHDVSYLLIDPTDIGKYPAYSRIGDSEEGDRYSWLPLITQDTSQFQETVNGTVRVYTNGGGFLADEDIIYEFEGQRIFLPNQKAVVIGVVVETIQEGDELRFQQPQVIFFYEGNQITLPLRYIYYNHQIVDFESGLESTIYIIPRIDESNGVKIDSMGSLIYLSPRTSKSLVAQLYLMNDPFNEYDGVELVHSEDAMPVQSLKSQGTNINEFIHFRGLQGPIKIWKINHQDNIIAREEFLREDGEFGEFDDLEFVK